METCPHCGAELPPKAKACPACGSDEQTGWSEEARYDGLDLPDDKFNYDEYVKREFSPGGGPRRIAWLWWTVAVMLVTGFFLLVLLPFLRR